MNEATRTRFDVLTALLGENPSGHSGHPRMKILDAHAEQMMLDGALDEIEIADVRDYQPVESFTVLEEKEVLGVSPTHVLRLDEAAKDICTERQRPIFWPRWFLERVPTHAIGS
jgi:DNA repair exonuclease SbcCD nuclease subunit